MMRKWSLMLVVLLFVALVSLGGCGGGGDSGGGSPTPAPGIDTGIRKFEDLKGSWESVAGSVSHKAVDSVTMEILPDPQVFLFVSYGGSGGAAEESYAREEFSAVENLGAGVFVLRFKDTGDTSGSMTFTVVDRNTLKVREEGTQTTWLPALSSLEYTLKRKGLAPSPAPKPEPSPAPEPAPSPAPGVSALKGKWDVHDGQGTFIEGGMEIQAQLTSGALDIEVIEPGLEYAGKAHFAMWSKFKAPGRTYDIGNEFLNVLLEPQTDPDGAHSFTLPGGTQTISVRLTNANEGMVRIKGSRRDGRGLFEFDVTFSITRQ